MKSIIDFAIALVGFLSIGAAGLYALRVIIQYRVTDNAIRIKLFGVFPVQSVQLKNIEEIRVVPAWTFGGEVLNPFIERWPSWVFSREAILITRRRGLARKILLSPRNPSEFLQEVQLKREKMI